MERRPNEPDSMPAVSPATRKSMLSNRSGKTKPELAVRRAAHRLGLRYLVDSAPLPGWRSRADLLFPSLKLAVYVDGCFWHGCPEHYKEPSGSRQAFWRDKIQRNVERDEQTNAALFQEGWTVLRIWEHEDVPEAALRIKCAVTILRSG